MTAYIFKIITLLGGLSLYIDFTCTFQALYGIYKSQNL